MSALPSLPPAPPLVVWGIPVLAVAVALAFVIGLREAARRDGRSPAAVRRVALVAGVGVALWMGVTAALAHAGVLARFDQRPPPMLVLMVAILGGGLGLGVSPVGRLLARLPLAVLVLAQAFRFPLELVMHEAATSNVMPRQLSYSGYNLDVVTGVSALVLGGLALWKRVPRWAVWTWSAWGSWCLLVIAGIALASSPIVRLWGDDSLNVWVLHFPYVWLPAVMVTFAVVGHVVVFRRLLAERAGATRDELTGPAPSRVR